MWGKLVEIIFVTGLFPSVLGEALAIGKPILATDCSPGVREHLLDGEIASNNGGWQWAASTGCDAQPWFRIFNPITQSQRFDAHGKFIRKYIPELSNCSDKEIHAPWLMSSVRQQELGIKIGKDYPEPIVDHSNQRLLTLDLYKQASQR